MSQGIDIQTNHANKTYRPAEVNTSYTYNRLQKSAGVFVIIIVVTVVRDKVMQ